MTPSQRKRPPSDFDLLKAIYARHSGDYGQGLLTPLGQKADVLIPIDIHAIAESLGVVFGRLYYHLDRAYGEPREPGKARQVFFTPVAGKESNCVNFPLLEAVLASLWQDRNRQLWATYVSVISIAIAIASLVVSITR